MSLLIFWKGGGAASYTLTSDPASLSLSGSVGNFDFVFVVNPSSLSLTGSTATLPFSKKLTSDLGNLTLTGSTASLPKIRVLGSSPQGLTLGGSDATLTFSGGGTSYSLTCDLSTLSFTGAAAATVAIVNQVRVFDTRFIGDNWIYEFGTYPPGYEGYYLVAINGGVSKVSYIGREVSDIASVVTDNGDGTITLDETVEVSKDKTDSVTQVNYVVIT